MSFAEYYDRTWDPKGDISPLQTEFATNLRIPVLTSSQPRWNYIIGIVVGEGSLDQGIMPNEDEITSVADRLEEYCTHWYRQSFRDAMAHFSPYDIDGGANGMMFIKRDNSGWAFRRRSWCEGAYWSSHPDGPIQSLPQVLDQTR